MGQVTLTGPDLSKGIASTELPVAGQLLGQADGEAVLLIRRGIEVLAIGGTCTHYGSSLGEALVDRDTIRCPWHHAAFDIHTGEAVEGPAYLPLPCWSVEEKDGRIRLLGKKTQRPNIHCEGPVSVAIIGAGAAGVSAAEELRRRGYEGPVTLIDDDADLPVDRPNLSKDNLAGTAPEDWLPLHPQSFYDENKLTRRRARVTSIDRAKQSLALSDGTSLSYGALLLAPGAAPIDLQLPGKGPPLFLLRTTADMRAIIKAIEGKKRAVVLGTSFIGLEVAASLRERGLGVHVVGPDVVPLARVLGPQLGNVVRSLHEKHGVVFHFEKRATALTEKGVVLSDGSTVEGELVIAGVGVRPSTSLAEAAGLVMDRGILVDSGLRTNDPAIYAAGDAARYPDRHSQELVRIEHWAVAQNQGRVAARNMLGLRETFRHVPYFWSQHYNVTIGYVGHAEKWDALEIDGDPEALDCAVKFVRGGSMLAVATINRDKASLAAHAAMMRGDV